MLTKNIVKQAKSIVEVQISAPWTDLESRWNETLTKLAGELELPGFRKGQVPISMAEQNLGSKFQEEFLKVVMPSLLIEALKGTDVVPIDYPRYQLVSFVKGGQLTFKAQVTGRPEVKVGNYKSIAVTRPVVKQIMDADVEKLVDDLFKRWKTRSSYVKTSDDNQPSGNVMSNPTGAGSMSFNQPASNTSASAMASADKPDDNFAKAVGAQSLVELKTKIKTDLENEAKYNNELDYEELILQEVEKMTICDAPEILVQDELNRMLVGLQRRVADMGLLLEDYLKGQNKTLEGLKTEWRGQAEKNVRMELGLAEIARNEKVEITDAELQAEIDKIQDGKMKAQFEAAEPRLHLKHSLRQIRTLDLLKTLVKNS
ncbi:MAG: Trigger factor [Microgenomates group bacterium GW2011_GWC1_39_7b]|uniref:Trigger factor n=1 Tax=Candidatus Daviesbacteria bacterium GW2011_GWB1_41_5 TaxID=1618429 RepID=A0A0G0ZN05_9BACT|nr:MAG: Trigger factor [Microgenomates group bacterium GW2011_GWC1_39_7b]KKS14373.1 MAG: Trigger factor [Candidatus Daviesbacteria bacterium GW2011_GWB1_41_5]